MLVIPSFAQPLLGQFAPVFLQPTYQRFLVLIVAATLTTGRRTVSNLLRHRCEHTRDEGEHADLLDMLVLLHRT